MSKKKTYCLIGFMGIIAVGCFIIFLVLRYLNLGNADMAVVKSFPFAADNMKRQGLILAFEIIGLLSTSLGICIVFFYYQYKKNKNQVKNILDQAIACQTLLEKAGCIVYNWDIIEDRIEFSENWQNEFGYKLVQNSFFKDMSDCPYVRKDDRTEFINFLDAIKHGSPYNEMVLKLVKENHEEIWIKNCLLGLPLGQNHARHGIGVFMNIHEQQCTIERFKNRSERDLLTGVYNKGTTEQLIQTYLSGAGKQKDGALLIIDIDNFKMVNDSKGHLFGDQVLMELVKKLKGFFRTRDIMGRIGGDEFIILMKDVHDRGVVEKKAGQILELFRNYQLNEEDDYKISISIGIAFYEENLVSYEQLFSQADEALYLAKNCGKDMFKVYQRLV